MTDRSKFEQMLEYLISEEQEKAKEIFHQLVVEKSREIYENILAEDFNEEKDEDEDDVEEGMEVTFRETESEDDEMEAAGDMDMMGGDDDMDPMGGDDDGEVGGDATDDFMGDLEGGDEEGDDSEGGEIEDRVMDLEDALDELRAEFEKELGGGDDDMGDDDMGDDMGGEEEEGEEEEEEIKDSFDVSDNFMREYIEKVTAGHGAERKGSGGDNGVNTKSIIDNMKNDMGGTTANIVKGGTEGGKGTQSGLLKPNTKEENFGNINVPGGNAGKTAFKKREPGHGAERKGNGDNGDKGAGSPINGVRSRAK